MTTLALGLAIRPRRSEGARMFDDPEKSGSTHRIETVVVIT